MNCHGIHEKKTLHIFFFSSFIHVLCIKLGEYQSSFFFVIQLNLLRKDFSRLSINL